MENEIEVFLTRETEITVYVEDEQFRFVYNPDTNFVLVPADVYGDRSEIIKSLKNHSRVDGVFNHEAISTATV